MSGSVNKVIIVGNLGADPEIRRTQDGKAITTLSIATSETWRDKNSGEKREKTEWHRIVSFSDGLNKVIEQYVKKGQTVYIEGKLQTRKWQDNEGRDKYTTEIVLQNFDGVLTMIGGNGSGDRNNGSQGQSNGYGDNPAGNAGGGFGGQSRGAGGVPSGGGDYEDDTEIPF